MNKVKYAQLFYSVVMPRYLSKQWCYQRYFQLYFLYGRQKYGHNTQMGLMSGYRSMMHLYEPMISGLVTTLRYEALVATFEQLRMQARALPESRFKTGFLLALEESDPRHYC